MVMIGGGSDGALGDMIAILTEMPFLGDVVKKLDLDQPHLGRIHQIRMLINSYQQLGEDLPDRTLQAIQSQVFDLEESLWKRAEVRAAVKRLLRPTTQRPVVQIANPDYHFNFSNMANRLVAQLLARTLVEEGGNDGVMPFRMGVYIVGADSLDSRHPCGVNHVAQFPEECAQYPHRISFVSKFQKSAAGITASFDAKLANPIIDAPRDVYGFDVSHHDVDRLLLRFGSNHNPDRLAADYQLPPPLCNKAVKGSGFLLVNPFDPF